MWRFQLTVDFKGLKRVLLVLFLVGLFIPASLVGAAPTYNISVPEVVSYQGQVMVGGQPFNGPGYFKFALVDQAGTTSYWSNDGQSTGGSEPGSAVQLTINKGQFSLLLGDLSITNMTQPLTASAFSGGARYLRIWFSQDNQNFQQLTPDRLIASVPYALAAGNAQEANHAASTDNALNADHAVSADSAKEASHAVNADNAANAGKASEAVNADTLDGQHAQALAMPSGAIMLGVPGDQRLSSFTRLGISSVACISCSGFEGRWGTELPTYSTPSSRFWNSAVWTGSEIIIWGGSDMTGMLNTGARYDPITNIWTPISTVNAPSPRYAHSAVWTGSEMIIWGGLGSSTFLNDGARYNPATDTWTTMNLDGAPSARRDHRAVWTGKEMIVWGGQGSTLLGDGARYNPSDDSWSLIPEEGNIGGRTQFTMEWTGSEMCLWGGTSGSSTPYRGDGACYDPAKTVNPWTIIPTSGAPSARYDHTSVWTGSEMIIWGGDNSQGKPDNTGARYNPATQTWTAITTTGAPNPRSTHTAVWTGSEMIVWGGWGVSSYLNDGARYNPASNTWTALATSGAPSARSGHMAVWTGGGSSGLGEMIIYGGLFNDIPLNTGGRYNLFLDLYQKP